MQLMNMVSNGAGGIWFIVKRIWVWELKKPELYNELSHSLTG